jgi:hypothetical protein
VLKFLFFSVMKMLQKKNSLDFIFILTFFYSKKKKEFTNFKFLKDQKFFEFLKNEMFFLEKIFELFIFISFFSNEYKIIIV